MSSLRAAYRKIFMSTDVNSGGIEGRLAEVVFPWSSFVTLVARSILTGIYA